MSLCESKPTICVKNAEKMSNFTIILEVEQGLQRVTERAPAL